MPMLAEPRRKKKWILLPKRGPQKPIWITETEGLKFGQKLMEKMGWSAGKGLGANEQGIQEPLRVSYKNDTKGMGYKLNEEEWISQQDEFNDFLMQLNDGNELSITKDKVQKAEMKSLEKKSKESRNRVHYQKFTRGKDLSQYSENDLACILGTIKNKKQISDSKETIIQEDSINNDIPTFGVKTINSGSLVDYFKSKLFEMKQKSSLTVDSDELSFEKSVNNEISKIEEKSGIKDKKIKTKQLDFAESSPNESENGTSDKNLLFDGNVNFKRKCDGKSWSEPCQKKKKKFFESISDCNNKINSNSLKITDEITVSNKSNFENTELLSTDICCQQIVNENFLSKKDKRKKNIDNCMVDKIELFCNSTKTPGKDENISRGKWIEEGFNEVYLPEVDLKINKKSKKKKEKLNDSVHDENEKAKTDQHKPNSYEQIDDEYTLHKKKKKKKRKNSEQNMTYDSDSNKKEEKKRKKNKINTFEENTSVSGDNNNCDGIESRPENSYSLDLVKLDDNGNNEIEKIRNKKKKKENKKNYMDDNILDGTINVPVEECQTNKSKKDKHEKNNLKKNEAFEDNSYCKRNESSTFDKLQEQSCKLNQKVDNGQCESLTKKYLENETNIIHTHKVELVKSKRKSLNLPQSICNLTTRGALKLIYGVQIDKFKGSNLHDLQGYGISTGTPTSTDFSVKN